LDSKSWESGYGKGRKKDWGVTETFERPAGESLMGGREGQLTVPVKDPKEKDGQ